jgi:hypothetical protein
MSNRKNDYFVGQNINNFLVVRRYEKDAKGLMLWYVVLECKCGRQREYDCGNLTYRIKNNNFMQQCRRCTTIINQPYQIGDKINGFTLIDIEFNKPKNIGSAEIYYVLQCCCGSPPVRYRRYEATSQYLCKQHPNRKEAMISLFFKKDMKQV